VNKSEKWHNRIMQENELENQITDTGANATPIKKEPKKLVLAILGSIASVLIFAPLIFIIISMGIFLNTHQAFGVGGESMMPTFQGNEIVYVRNQAPKRGDTVVIFAKHLENRPDIVDPYMLKRVVAVAGDTVDIVNNAGDYRLMRNGHDITLCYIDAEYLITLPGITMQTIMRSHFFYFEFYKAQNPTRVGEGGVLILSGEVFVLGDNRTNSHDSSDFGPIPINGTDFKVIGVVRHIIPGGTSQFKHYFMRFWFAAQF